MSNKTITGEAKRDLIEDGCADTVRKIILLNENEKESFRITLENEFLTLWIDGNMITNGSIEVVQRVDQIIRERGLEYI